MPEQVYNQKLRDILIGRRLLEHDMPAAHQGRPMFSFWGEEIGFSSGDVHQNRAYRIYLDYDETLTITWADVIVEGELISPCAGYFIEPLDEFDYPKVLQWCMEHTMDGSRKKYG